MPLWKQIGNCHVTVSLLFWCTKNIVIKNGVGTIFPFKSTFDDNFTLKKSLFGNKREMAICQILFCSQRAFLKGGPCHQKRFLKEKCIQKTNHGVVLVVQISTP